MLLKRRSRWAGWFNVCTSLFSVSVGVFLGLSLGIGLAGLPGALAKGPLPGSRNVELCELLLKDFPIPRLSEFKVRQTLRDFPHLFELTEPASELTPEPWETDSAARYARFISKEDQEKVLLVTAFGRQNVPFLDGVIFGAHDEAVANVSFKTLLKARDPGEAINRAFKYLVPESARNNGRSHVSRSTWLEILNDAHTELQRKVWSDLPEDVRALEHRRDELETLFRLFGIPPAGRARAFSGKGSSAVEVGASDLSGRHLRPTRVVIDITSDGALPKVDVRIARLQAKIRESQGRVESIFIMKGDEALEIRVDSFRHIKLEG